MVFKKRVLDDFISSALSLIIFFFQQNKINVQKALKTFKLVMIYILNLQALNFHNKVSN